jgi:hypothetical protein
MSTHGHPALIFDAQGRLDLPLMSFARLDDAGGSSDRDRQHGTVQPLLSFARSLAAS